MALKLQKGTFSTLKICPIPKRASWVIQTIENCVALFFFFFDCPYLHWIHQWTAIKWHFGIPFLSIWSILAFPFFPLGFSNLPELCRRTSFLCLRCFTVGTLWVNNSGWLVVCACVCVSSEPSSFSLHGICVHLGRLSSSNLTRKISWLWGAFLLQMGTSHPSAVKSVGHCPKTVWAALLLWESRQKFFQLIFLPVYEK